MTRLAKAASTQRAQRTADIPISASTGGMWAPEGSEENQTPQTGMSLPLLKRALRIKCLDLKIIIIYSSVSLRTKKVEGRTSFRDVKHKNG